MSEEAQLRRQAARIHKRVLTIDTHVDTPLNITRNQADMGVRGDARALNGSQVDFIRMAEGGLDAAFFAVFLAQGERSPNANNQAYAKAMGIIDDIYKAIGKHPELAEMATAPADAQRLADEGKRAVYLGLENGYPLGSDLSLVRSFYDLGVRYITLCHTKNNDICDSSTDTTEHCGLSKFGREVVREMNCLGMMVDVSHISDEAVRDVLEMTTAPVIASHSCADAVNEHDRNLNDELLKAIAANGGVVQMCFLSEYVREVEQTVERDSAYKAYKEKWGEYDERSDEEKRLSRIDYHKMGQEFPQRLATVADVVDHIDHMVEVMGIDHVGIGTDFDGGGGLADCYDASELGNVTFELLKRGYSDEDIAKIWGGNLLRVFEEVASQVQ